MKDEPIAANPDPSEASPLAQASAEQLPPIKPAGVEESAADTSSGGKSSGDKSDGGKSGVGKSNRGDSGVDESPDSEEGGGRVQLDSTDLQLIVTADMSSKASDVSLDAGVVSPVTGASESVSLPLAPSSTVPSVAMGETPGPDAPSRSESAVTAAVADALQVDNPLAKFERPRSSPPPPPSRRRSDLAAVPLASNLFGTVPAASVASSGSVAIGVSDVGAVATSNKAPAAGAVLTGAGAISISPISALGGSSLPPVELRRVLPARSIRGRALPGGQSGASQSLVEPNRIIEVLGSSTPVFSDNWPDEVEDLDDSEAYELSDTPLPESLTDELVVEVDDSSPAASADVVVPVAPAAPVAPPKKKRRRPPARSSGAGGSSTAVSSKLAGATKSEGSGRKPWWEELFSQDFLRAIPILLPRQLNREVNFIESELSVVPGGRILDLACGAGQHAVELASRGYEVVGFDSSQAQLDWAGELALERMQKLQFINGDMRTLTYQEAFDGISCWNTSFGYFEEEKNLDVAQRMFAALRPGGRLLLDVVNRDYVVAQQPGQTWFEGDGCVCIDDVTIDFITSRMRVKRTMMLTSGKNLECNYSLRLYGLHELGKLLHSVGFKVAKVSGRFETPGVFFGDASPRLMILASKPHD